MKHLRPIFFVAIIFLFALLAAGCSAPKTPIKIAISAWAGVEPAELAAQLGYYTKRGVEVEVIRFSAYSDSIDALRAGKVDAGMHTLDDSIRTAAAGKDVRVVLFTDYSFGADGLVAQANVGSLEELKGKKIGVEIGTVGHFSFLKILEFARLTPDDVSIVSIPAWEIEQNMIAGQIDAGVTWEPYLTKTAQEISGQVLITSRDYPETIVTTMTFSADVIKNRPDDVQKVVAAYFDAVKYLKSNQQDAYERMAKLEGISAEEFAAHAQGVQFLDLALNTGLFGQGSGKIYTVTDEIARFLLDQQVIRSPIAAQSVLEPRFIDALNGK